MKAEDVRKEIETEYDWYMAEHRHEPNVAYVKCQWYGNNEPEDCIQTIVLDNDWYNELAAENGEEYVVPFIKDDDVLYYCSGIDDLLHITEEDTACDFKVVDFVGFERLK